MDAPTASVSKRRLRHRLLYRLEAGLKAHMFLLSIFWLWHFIDELVMALSPWQEAAVTAI